MNPENILIAQAKQGDKDAFTRLRGLHEKSIKGFLRARISDKDLHRLLEQIFTRISQKLPSYEPERASFAAWARTLAKDQLLTYFRNTKGGIVR